MANRALKGSERKPMEGAHSVGKADPTERLEVTVLVRRRAAEALHDHVKQLHVTSARPKHLAREEFASKFGADPKIFRR